MENISNSNVRCSINERDIFYYRYRYRERVYQSVMEYFALCAERSGLTKAQISQALNRDPASISRWFSGPGNWTLDTVSDLLVAMDAEMSDEIMPFDEHGVTSTAASTSGNGPKIYMDDLSRSGTSEPERLRISSS